MSPIKTLEAQRRGRQIGEVRLGATVPTANGGTRPTKLDTFRFTTKSPTIARAVAASLCGEAREATLANGDPTNEVITSVTELHVMVPPGDAAISQWNEMYSAGGIQRRCDGETEQLTRSACKCPFDVAERLEMAAKGQACKPTTRLNIILPDIPDLGVWKVESHGFYAAIELGGAAELLAAAREQGVIVPATLRLEQRQIKRGGKTNKFAVPVLEIGATLRELTALESGRGIAASLPPPPVAAIGTGNAPSNVSTPQPVKSIEPAMKEQPVSAKADAFEMSKIKTAIRTRHAELSPAKKVEFDTWMDNEKRSDGVRFGSRMRPEDAEIINGKLDKLTRPDAPLFIDDDEPIDAEIYEEELFT